MNFSQSSTGRPEVLQLKCPRCAHALRLMRRHIGVPGRCVSCHLPIRAVETSSGEVEVASLEPAVAPPVAPTEKAPDAPMPIEEVPAATAEAPAEVVKDDPPVSEPPATTKSPWGFAEAIQREEERASRQPEQETEMELPEADPSPPKCPETGDSPGDDLVAALVAGAPEPLAVPGKSEENPDLPSPEIPVATPRKEPPPLPWQTPGDTIEPSKDEASEVAGEPFLFSGLPAAEIEGEAEEESDPPLFGTEPEENGVEDPGFASLFDDTDASPTGASPFDSPSPPPVTSPQPDEGIGTLFPGSVPAAETESAGEKRATPPPLPRCETGERPGQAEPTPPALGEAEPDEAETASAEIQARNFFTEDDPAKREPLFRVETPPADDPASQDWSEAPLQVPLDPGLKWKGKVPGRRWTLSNLRIPLAIFVVLTIVFLSLHLWVTPDRADRFKAQFSEWIEPGFVLFEKLPFGLGEKLTQPSKPAENQDRSAVLPSPLVPESGNTAAPAMRPTL